MSKPTTTLANGTRIAYLERPGGEIPLLLLHGITDNALSYEPLIPEIHPLARVFAMDFRGHGESGKPDSRYDTEAYADDVRHFIREVVGGPVLLEGHSLGGVVALQVAVTEPSLVRGLLLEDPPLYFVNNLNEIYRTLFTAMVAMARSLQDGTRSRDDWFKVMAEAPDPYTGRPGIETLGAGGIGLRLDSIASMKPEALEDALDGSLEWETDEVLARVRCPLTIITGNPELGAVITPEEAARVSGIVPEARLVRMDNTGHLIHMEQPEAWLRVLNQWVRPSA